MTSCQLHVAERILNEHFGAVIEKVAVFLLKKGPTPLRAVSNDIGLKVDQAKKAISVLIQHNIVDFKVHKKGYVEYIANVGNILTLLRFPKYIYSAKSLFGDDGELLVEELLHHGQAEMSDIVNRVTDRLNESAEAGQQTSIFKVREKFVSLAETHFIRRLPAVEVVENKKTRGVPSFAAEEAADAEMYNVPQIENNKKRKRDPDDDEAGPSAKRTKSDTGVTYADKGIVWQIDYDRFNYYLRDQVIVDSVNRKLDKKAGSVIRTLLRMSETRTALESLSTTPVSYNEIFQELPDGCGIDRQMLDQYLKILVDDSAEFLLKVGDSGGGMYSLHFKKIYETLCIAHIESVVQERFGSKCLRIFKLLLQKKRLEQKQIEECAMIPAKEAKELLYRMFGEHFITLMELPRTPDHAPSRTFYLFSVDVNKVARMFLERCLKAITNLKCRRDMETKEHKRLLDKQQRLEAIVASLEQSGAEAAQKAEIEEMITPSEREQLARIKHMTNKLGQSEIQMDDTIFVLETYLRYSLMK